MHAIQNSEAITLNKVKEVQEISRNDFADHVQNKGCVGAIAAPNQKALAAPKVQNAIDKAHDFEIEL